MKRYQCIKNWVTFDNEHVFTQGIVYPECDRQPLFTGGAVLIDNTGVCVELSDVTLHDFFHELPPSDIPRDEADPEPFITPEPKRAMGMGCAVIIITVLTVTAIILSEIL